MGSPFETLVEIYEASTRRFSDRELFGEKRDGAWVWMTYRRFSQLVDDLRGAMAQLGIEPGDRVAVISNNRSEWAIAAYAAYSRGATYVPMYEVQQPAEWRYILADCGAKIVFVADGRIDGEIRAHRGSLPALEHVIHFFGNDADPDGIHALFRRGAQSPAPIFRSRPSDVAGLIYTSGTTGNPKGVMLTHANLARNVSATHDLFPIRPDDRSLSFLPWAHSFGQVAELHALYSRGASMGIAESREKIIDNLAEVKPTLLFAVPQVFNRFYQRVRQRVREEGVVKRLLFERALHVAAARKALEASGRSSAFLEAQHHWLDRVILSRVRARFGGRLEYAFSGGASLSREVAEFIDDVGITVYEGYGLTETSPIVTTNSPGSRKMGSVGKPIPGVRVEIDREVTGDPQNGEVVVFGHNVMLGYYNLAEESAKVFTSDGGLRTGDTGYLDADGYLWITGRIKEGYKLDNGKYVVPAHIEQALALSPYVSNAMVYGQNRPWNVAILVAEVRALKEWAEGRGLDASSIAALLTSPEVKRLYRDEIERCTSDVKAYERPREFLLVEEDFSSANDMLTPSLKIKRRNVLAKYGPQIDALYASAAQKGHETRAA
jgi:long-chain acyl-CoA synthetase